MRRRTDSKEPSNSSFIGEKKQDMPDFAMLTSRDRRDRIDIVKECRECLRDGIKDAWVYSRISAALTDLGMFDKAEKYCRKGLAKYPTYWGLHDTMGLIKRRTGNPAAAIPYYDRAIRYYKKGTRGKTTVALVYNNKGSALSDLERYEDAIECFDAALEIEPDYTRASFNKYLRLISLSREDEAKIFLREQVTQSKNQAKFMKDFDKYMKNLILIKKR